MLIAGSTTANAPSTSSVSYVGPFQTTAAASPTEASVQGVVPISGTVSNLAVNLANNAQNGGGTQTWTFTVRKNGTPTAITCTVTEATSSCTSTATETFAAGDLISLEAKPGGSPSNWGSLRWAVTLTG
jgi:hypothetical protein